MTSKAAFIYSIKMQKGRILVSFLLVSIFLTAILLFTGKRYSLRVETINAQKSFIAKASDIHTPTPTPELPTPTPSPVPTVSLRPTRIPQVQILSKSGLSNLLFQINTLRKANGLPAVSQDPQTCSFAKIRAREIAFNFTHNGFTNRINSHTLPYPSYHDVTENIAMNDDENDVVPQWISSPGHRENMKKDTPFVCVVRYGKFYAYEGWKP